MQIQHVTETELGLLITGIRAIHVMDCEPTRRKLAIQLETELSSRFGTCIGKPEDQERNQVPCD